MSINKDFLVKNGIQVGGNASVTGSLTAAGLSYPVSDGDPYMAVVTDGFGNLSFNNVDTVESDVTNQTGSLIPKGSPVYQTGAAGQTLTIALSDASDPATMPAIGVAASDIADGDTGRVIHFGYIKGVDTSSFSEGSRIYVADGGGYQEGRPTGEGNVVQFLGVVTKVHATNGSGVVFGGGRSMDVPNLNDGNIFIGDSTNTAVTATLDTDITPEGSNNLYFTDTRAVDAVEAHPHLTIDGGTLYVDTDSNRIGINDTSPQEALDVNGNARVAGIITSTRDNYAKVSLINTGTYASNWVLENTNGKFGITDANAAATYLYIAQGGNIGIGTASPSGKLHVASPDGNNDSLIVGRSDVASYWRFNHAGNDLRIYNNDGAGQDILFGLNSGGTYQNNKVGIANPTPQAKLDIQATLTGEQAFRISHPTAPTDAGLYLGLGPTVGTLSNDMAVIGVEYGGVSKDAIIINRSNTNIGINETNPVGQLHITSRDNTTDSIRIIGGGGNKFIAGYGNQGQISFSLSEVGGADPGEFILYNGGSIQHWMDADGGVTFNEQGLNIPFRVEASGQSSALFVRGSDGNVGIGTSTPDEALQVIGNVNISGSIEYGNTVVKSGKLGTNWDGTNTAHPIAVAIGASQQYAGEVFDVTVSFRGDTYARAMFVHDPEGAAIGKLYRTYREGNFEISAKFDEADRNIEFYVSTNSSTPADSAVEVKMYIADSSGVQAGVTTITIDPTASVLTSPVTASDYTGGKTFRYGDFEVDSSYATDYNPTAPGWNTWGDSQLVVRNRDNASLNNYASIGMFTGGSSGNFSSRYVNICDQAGRGAVAWMLRDDAHTDYTQEKMRLTSGGTLGINTTNPQESFKLDVNGSAIIRNDLYVFDDIVGYDGSAFQISTSGDSWINGGKVGIGTSSPVELLYVNSSSGDARIGLNAPTGSDTEIKFSNNDTVEYTIGHDDATDNFVIGTTNVDADLVSVTKSGNVGIGTSTPDDKLQVQGTIRAYTPTANDWTFIGYNSANTATSGLWYSNDSARFLGRNASNQLTVDLHSAGVSYLNGGNVGIGTTAPVQKLDVAGNVKHEGLTMTDGWDIDQLKTFTQSIQVTTEWQNTGIDSTDIVANGTFIIQLVADNYDVGGTLYREIYSGVMSWRGNDSTNSPIADEIVLHAAGHAENSGRLFLRTQRTYAATDGKLHLQIKGSVNTNAPDNYTFKFRRMI